MFDEKRDVSEDAHEAGVTGRNISSIVFRLETMSGVTCITCRVAFNSADLQRFHYKSDWHRYNLKRKVAAMPPVTAEDFKQRVLAQQAQSAESEKDTSTYCKICGKNFNCWNAYSNHLQSKKHKDAETKALKRGQSEVAKENEKNKEKGLLETEKTQKEVSLTTHSPGARRKDARVAEVDDDEDDDGWEDVEDEPIPATSCLFCSHSSESLEGNVDHMTLEHSFFIPNIDYLIDPEALLEYLGEKVGRGLMCLWCNERSKMFFSVDSAQRHMRDKGHCKIQYDGTAALEYSDFFDFRSSYPDHEERDGDDEDDEVEVAALEQDGYELILPSGARIGHRELMRYYNQNLPPKRELVLKNDGVTKKLKNYYKAIGWSGPSGDVYAKQRKDMKVIQRFRDKQRLKLQTKANGMQKHFRPQVVF